MDTVEQTIRTYFDALNRSDVDGVVSLLTQDALLLRDEADTVSGRDQIRAAFGEIFKAISLKREVSINQAQEGRDTAVVVTHTTGTVTFLANDTTIDAVARELVVLRRSAVGWLISAYAHNRPGGMAM